VAAFQNGRLLFQEAPMTAPITVSPADLPLQCLYRWEHERANQTYLTQPMGGGNVQDISWQAAADQVRRTAAWLAAQGWLKAAGLRSLAKQCALDTGRSGDSDGGFCLGAHLPHV
jgi:hypothetical protein